MDNNDLSLHGQQFKKTYQMSFSQKIFTSKSIMLFVHRILNKNMRPHIYTVFFFSISLLSPLLHRNTLTLSTVPHLRLPQPKHIILVSLPLLRFPYFFNPYLLRLGFDLLTINPVPSITLLISLSDSRYVDGNQGCW